MLGPCHPIMSRWHCYTIGFSLAWDYLANDNFGPLRKVWFWFTGVDWSYSWWFKKHLHLQNLFDRLLTMCHLINWNIVTQRNINHIIKPRFGKKEISPNWKKSEIYKIELASTSNLRKVKCSDSSSSWRQTCRQVRLRNRTLLIQIMPIIKNVSFNDVLN